MTQQVNNVLRKTGLLTETFYRNRVADIIRSLQVQHSLSDQDLADLVSCSAATIANARNGNGKLQGHTLFNLMAVADTALDGLLHHFDRRSVPIAAKCDTDALPSTANAVHKLAVVTCADSPGGKLITDNEALEIEPSIDAAIESLNSIKARCHDIRARRVA